MKNFNLTRRLTQAVIEVQIQIDAVLQNKQGQDLIEYALMAGFVAVTAGAVMPGISRSISTIFSKVASVMTSAASQGS